MKQARSRYAIALRGTRNKPAQNQPLLFFDVGFIRRLLICLIPLAVCSVLPPAYGSPTSADPMRTLTVGGNSDFAPYEFINTRGDPDGYTVDLMKAVAHELGLKVNITLGSWQDMRQRLENGQIDALTGVLYSAERDKVMDFSVPHTVISYAVFVRKGTDFRSVSDLENKEVIVVANVYAHDWLRTNQFTPHIFTVDRPDKALRLLSSGKHDFAVLPRLHGLDLLRQLDIDNVESVGPPVLSQKFCFAVTAGDADLLAQLNEGLVSVQKSGVYDEIYLKWFSVYEHKKQFKRWALRFGVPLLFLVLIAVAWNLSLKKTVALKTKKLHKNEAWLTQIIQALPMPTFVVDKDHTVIHWNKACENLTGISADQVIGTPNHKTAFYHGERPAMSDLLLDNMPPETMCHLLGPQYRPSSIVEGACEAEFFFSWMGSEGKWLCGTAALMCDPDSQVVGAIESWQDLTEHKKLELQLIQSQKMEAMGTLAGGIAHDFGNILTAIMGNIAMARTEIPSEHPIGEYLQSVSHLCGHAKNLIHRILTFSRQSAVDIKPARIESLVNEALDLIQATLPSNIQIRRELRSEALVAVDVTQMRQVLINLCTNAAHAMRGQSGIVTVCLTAADHDLDGLADKLETGRGAFVKLSVSDSGHGIPAEIMNRIFDPFFTTKKRGVGTGMGLSISYSIVKRFGGTITAESQPGQGATFNVFLPVIETQAETESLSMQTMPKGTERILIVNGDSMTHGLDRQVLEQLGYQIQVQDSADAAVRMLQTQPDSADLVVLICNESDRSLAAVIQKLKSVRSRLPIILVSGYSAGPERIRAKRLGVEAVIQKPVITHELAEMIRKLLDEVTTA